jgi:NitT/TauT family transport system substrate-binding protein
MRSSRRSRTIALATAALLATISGCGSDSDPSPQSSGDGTERVSLTVAPASPSFVSQAYYYLANDLGYFDEENLDVEIISQFEGGSTEVALVEGKLDIVAGSPTSFFERLQQDPATPTHCVATTGLWPFRIMVPKDSPVKTVADLAGEDIGVPEVSDVSTLGFLLASADMSVDDVKAVPVGGRAPAAVEMENGNTAAFMGTHVDQLAIEETGFAVRILKTVESSSTFNTCMLVTTETLTDKRDVVVRFLRGLAKGFALQNEDPELAVALLGKGRPEAFDDAEAAVALMKATNGVNGGTYDAKWTYPEEEWQAMVDDFAEAGTISASFDIADNIDFSLMEEVWNFDVQQVLEQARAAK